MERHNCMFCEKTFSRKRSLNIHLRIHTGEKACECETCGKVFSRKVYLLLHEKRHAGDKPFRCFCGKRFAEMGGFKKHELTHNGQKNLQKTEELSSGICGHECDVCHSLFASSEAMESHKRRHPHMVPDKKHKCSLCSYSTDDSGRLKDHLLSHAKVKPHQCTFCKKSFTQKNNMVIHLRVHTGERPFQCVTCERGFARKDKLLVHERSHTGERPYVCSLCGKRFGRRSCLKNHEGTHTGQKCP